MTSTLEKRRNAVMDWIGKLGISQDRVFNAIEVKGLEDIGIKQLELLTGLKTAIKEGDASVDEAFPIAVDKTMADPFAKKESKTQKEPQAKSPQADLIPDSPDPKTGTYKEKFNAVWDELEASGMKVEEIANKLFVKGFRSDPQAETDEKEQKRILKYLESLKGK